MDPSIRKRPTLKLWVRLVLSIVIISGIFIPIFEIILNSIEVNNTSNGDILYAYNTDKNLTYKVKLYDNSFTDTTEMEENKIYISDLVKNINTNFAYTYSGTDKINLTYSYDIKAKLTGENQSSQTTGTNEVVWEKDYTILDTVNKTTSRNGFAINENIDIDYPKYKNEVLNFRKKFGMSLSTKLQVVMTVQIDGKYQDEKINKTDKIVMNIPVGNQSFSITQDYKKHDVKEIREQVKNIEIENKSYTIICLIITFTSIILFIISFKAIFNVKPKSEYTKKLEKILKNYDQIIVEVENPVREKNCNIALVKSFEEMLDLEEELRIPIIFYENIYNHTAVFTISHNNILYKYVLR